MWLLARPAVAALTGVLAGTVVDANTQQPIAGAVVSVVSLGGHYQTKTDAKGGFSIAGVTFDTYTVTITARGYKSYALDGVTVTGDEVTRLSPALSRVSVVIGRIQARSLSNAFQPTQTVDRYTVNAAGIDQLLGKSFDTDEKKLLSELPGVTVDRSGTPLIRGGSSFETALLFEGIDYTTPQRSVVNRYQNIGNSDLLNGAGSVEIIPGAGDATHGNTGTGLIIFTAKRGTYPAFGTVDGEFGIVPTTDLNGDAVQGGFEYGIATKNNAVSNYLSYINDNQVYQYGNFGTPASSLSASATAPDQNLYNNINSRFGAQYTSAYFNTASQWSRDFLDNLVVHFGHEQNQSLQFFIQSQAVRQYLNYGGYAGLTTPTVPQLIGSRSSLPNIFGDNAGLNAATIDANIAATGILSNYPPGVAPGTPLGGPGTTYSPFEAFKVEHNYALSDSTVFATRFYRTFNNQQQSEPDQGIDVLSNGGSRTGIATDITKTLGNAKHLFQIGGKYEFAAPYGVALDNADYAGALSDVHDIGPDFVAPAPAFQMPYNGPNGEVYLTTSGTPGCSGTPITLVNPDGSMTPETATGTYNCGYLAKYFPKGIPAIPAEVEVPTAQQQSYGLYLQDTWSPNRRVKVLLGMRLDGYNFLIPNDAQNPPAVNGLEHQRLYEPHFGFSDQLSPVDAVRLNFGRSLAIPLPTFIGADINRAAYSAFNAVPSYDNLTGLPATYCGPGVPTTGSNGITTYSGTQTCTSYADQLYWLYRNWRFGPQMQLNYPLQGSTFTNYDASLSHLFHDGTGLKLTPFYRIGYGVVEDTRTFLGRDPVTEAAILSPDVYTNLGTQRATGVELDVTKFNAFGWSGQLSATYINQIGNDPPGTYLPTQSLTLGLLYPSPNLAPLQLTLAMTYRTHSGWRINPVINVQSGYPFGQGVYAAQTVDGQIVYVPATDATTFGNQGASFSNAQVDPQNPGTIANPNIIASRGTESLTSGPGSLRSVSTVNVDLTVQYTQPGSRWTFGLALTNLFNYVNDIPVVNYTRTTVPVATGINATTGQLTATAGPAYSTPTSAGSAYGPYIIFPNGPPFSARLYAQFAL